MARKQRRESTTTTTTRPAPRAATFSSPLERWIKKAMSGDDGEEFGIPVTASTVRGVPAAWYSINKIAGHIGLLPLNLYQRVGDDDARIAREHPAYWLLRQQPNDLMTAAVFRETIQHHALLHGNGRAAILRNGRGEPSELLVMQPSKWTIVIQPPQLIGSQWAPQRKWHVRADDPEIKIDDEDCLHIMGLSDDGLAGISIIDCCRQAFGLAVAQQWRALKSEKNGARVKFLLKAPPGVFREEGKAQEFIDAFNSKHAGADNAEKVALLREGIEAQSISQTNVESQAIEGQRFSRQNLGLLFMVESMLGDDSSVSYNSLEMKNQAYLTNCLMRWLNKWEQECGRKLLTTAEFNSEQWYFRFVTQALLRGTTQERFAVYQIARQIGVMNANEIRELEDMNARTDPGGESYDNPSTTPGGAVVEQEDLSADDQEDADERDGDQPALNARLTRVVQRRLASMANVESSRVQAAAIKEANFVGWLDEFYAGWQPKTEDAIRDCEGSLTLAADWVSESKRRLLDVAGRVEQSGLSEAVRSELLAWNERSKQLASAVMAGGV